MSGRAGPNAAESTTLLADTAGVLSQIPALHSFGPKCKSTFPKLPQKVSQECCVCSICLSGTVPGPYLPSGLDQGNHKHTAHGDGHFLGSLTQSLGQGDPELSTCCRQSAGPSHHWKRSLELFKCNQTFIKMTPNCDALENAKVAMFSQ